MAGAILMAAKREVWAIEMDGIPVWSSCVRSVAVKLASSLTKVSGVKHMSRATSQPPLPGGRNERIGQNAVENRRRFYHGTTFWDWLSPWANRLCARKDCRPMNDPTKLEAGSPQAETAQDESVAVSVMLILCLL
jgi:hypothetical protein